MNQVFKALVIDDEPAARRLMKSLLQDYTDIVEVIGEAGTGTEAIQLIEQLHPDLVFLDIQMPDLTGFEVLERLQHKPNVIFTTAYEQYASRHSITFLSITCSNQSRRNAWKKVWPNSNSLDALISL